VAPCTLPYTTTEASSHPITATYSGDASFPPTSPTRRSSDLGVSASTTAPASSLNPSRADQSVTYTATVSPHPDGGTVAFSDGTTTISGCGAQAVNTATGVATCTVLYTSTVGSPHSITAAYSGDANYHSSTSAALLQTVLAAASTYASPGTFSFTVPDGWTQVSLDVYGAQGAAAGGSGPGGLGGESRATISVTSGQVLEIVVGGSGGGGSGSASPYGGGGNGGGASDVRSGACATAATCALVDRVVV